MNLTVMNAVIGIVGVGFLVVEWACTVSHVRRFDTAARLAAGRHAQVEAVTRMSLCRTMDR